MINYLRKVYQFFAFFENVACFLGLILTTSLVFFQVINRYWLHLEIMWFGDLALYLFIFMMFFSVGVTTRERGHTLVEVFVDKFTKGNIFRKTYYNLFINTFSLLIVLLFVFPVFQFAKRAWEYPQYGTLVRWFNTSWLMEAFFLMVVLIIFHLSKNIFEDIEQARKNQILSRKENS